MKLTYWYAKCLNDSDAYSVRQKTRKAAEADKLSRHKSGDYGPVVKVTVEYDNAFDLMEKCSDEDGQRCRESQATYLATKTEN